MKKNYFLLIFLLLANIFSAVAITNDILSTQALSITIKVDQASNVKITKGAGYGDVLVLNDGVNSLQIEPSSDNPLLIEAAEGQKLESVKVNDSPASPSGDGKYRIGVMNDGMVIEIITKKISSVPTVTFQVDDPSHVVVKAGGQLVSDISSPQTFAKETVLNISAASGFIITGFSTNNRPSFSPVDGVYSVTVTEDVTIYIYTKESTLRNITIEVDDASNIKAAMQAGNDDLLTLSNGSNSLQLDDTKNPLAIMPADDATIKSLKVNGTLSTPAGDGKYRFGISEGMKIEIVTKKNSANPTVEFSVTDASHIIVKAGDQVVQDISSPQEFAKSTRLVISAAKGYTITHISTSNIPTVPQVDGAYSFLVDQDMTVYVTSKTADPLVTFNVDFPNRVTVTNIESHEAIDITSQKVFIPKGTQLEFKASDPKYTIKTFKVNGEDKSGSHTPGGQGSGVFNWGISDDVTFDISTSSTANPSVRFLVDKPENIKVHIAGSTELLDVSKPYELNKNAQIIIEPVSDEIRIASVIANGQIMTALSNGTYAIAASVDLAITVKTKKNVPNLTFNVDFPERINVMNGTVKLNIDGVVEFVKNAVLTIEAAAENFKIKTIMADGELLTVGEDGKYHVTVTKDMAFEIKTAAALKLHIATSEGGILSVFRNGVELHEGDMVNSTDELLFKNKPNKGYVFGGYTVNGRRVLEKYVVSGSEDISVAATFRIPREGYALVSFDISDPNVYLTYTGTPDEYVYQPIEDLTVPFEAKIGGKISVVLYKTRGYIKSCTVNGVEVEPTVLGEEPNTSIAYYLIITENSLVKVTTGLRVQVSGDIVNDEQLNTIGRVFIKYNGEETYNSTHVDVGDTFEVIGIPSEGYKLDYLTQKYPVITAIEGTTYSRTVTQEDYDKGALLTYSGVFSKEGVGIESMSSLKSYYDEASMQVVTIGGNTKIYTVSGEMVMESNDTNISVVSLERGMYVVKTQNVVFKFIKK